MTDARAREAELTSKLRSLSILSECNKALVYAKSEADLLERFCETLVSLGGYACAWVGRILERPAAIVTPLVCVGDHCRDHALAKRAFQWNPDGATPHDPVAYCVAHGDPVYVDTPSDAGSDADDLFYGGGACLPLMGEKQRYGVLIVHRSVWSRTSDDERALLSELTQNLSFGLQARHIKRRDDRTHRALEEIGGALTARTSAQFFDQMTLKVAAALDADGAFVARLRVNDDSWAEPVAGVLDGNPVTLPPYQLAGTPCETAIAGPACAYAQDVAALFPEDRDLVSLQAEGYVGQRLESAVGEPIGVLFVVYRRPVFESERVSSVLNLVSGRVSAELERLDTDEHIHHLAYRDTTTQLPNRAACQDHLTDLIKQGVAAVQSVTLLVLNLKRFTEINDSLGHAVGDSLLHAVGLRLRSELDEKVYVARLSGDEFGIVLQGVNAETQDHAILKAIQTGMTRAFDLEAARIHVSATIGGANFPNHASTAEELMQHANVALQDARKRGVPYAAYQARLLEGLRKQLRMAERLTQALVDDALCVHYQPQVDFTTQALVGVEALIRWHDGERGWISPAAFLPVAEQRGLVGEIFECVLSRVCRDLAAWRDQGVPLPTPVSINVSPEQIHDERLPEHILNTASQHGLSAGSISIEITESELMRDPERAAVILTELRQQGCRVAIDDFGTGYSSLAYLKHLPIDTLKIDLSFTRDMLDNASDRAIVATIVAMAQTLGLDCLAEGVETPHQCQALLALGCRHGQGYLFGRAMTPAALAERWLLARTLKVPNGRTSL